MITIDDSISPSIVGVECDFPGCKVSSTITASSRSDAINLIHSRMVDGGWYVRTSMPSVQHFCPGCGQTEDDVSKLSKGRMVGSQVVPSLSSTVVSAQDIRSSRSVSEAVEIRATRKRDIERGTPGLSEIDDAQKTVLIDKLKRGLKVFGEDD